MAYAFNKVDDYFRRNKTGGQGSLEKGNTGAAAPTAAAENLARVAETSAQQGNSETGQFRAANSANTAAIQNSLMQPAAQQARDWTANETAKAGEVQKTGEAQIAKTYQTFDAGDIAKAEAGQANPLAQQVNYTGKESTFNPYQVAMPAIESQQQLSGGVGGMQAALQKQRGGRYTAGMGALDASVLANNNQAMQGVRSALGGIQENARGVKQNLEQLDEKLAAQALTKGTDTAATVRKAIQDRMGIVSQDTIKKLEQRGADLSGQSRAALLPQFGIMGSSNPVEDALLNALRAQGVSEDEINSKLREAGDINYNHFIKQNGRAEVTETPQNYQNLASILGVGTTPFRQSYGTYGIDQNAIDTQARAIKELGGYRVPGSADPNAVRGEEWEYGGSFTPEWLKGIL